MKVAFWVRANLASDGNEIVVIVAGLAQGDYERPLWGT
ncbi:MAG: hypothetical protein KatS3mg110_2989 [Pirellulaceae bacterium]|nr:MAG: hypothetical protein KatS3mg110_2989 [Pirellulaceae bacterium]